MSAYPPMATVERKGAKERHRLDHDPSAQASGIVN
jgi:hypothetical protein